MLRDDDSKPVENASVIFQLVGEKGNMELKTNEDGKTMIDVLPTGSKIVVQVIAHGFQTYGGEYTLDKPQIAIEVKLRRPGQQYSIYEQRPQAAKSDQTNPSDSDKNADSKKDSSKNQPSESAKESDSKPDSSQPQ